ncbi:MAG: methyltransferase domain-containing protein [Chloroflexota bacterium]
MREEILIYLVCPDCKSTLNCEAAEQVGNEIITGSLRCTNCLKTYPILRGIPRFITSEIRLSGKNIETAAAFGWEWQKFSYLHDVETYQEQFLDWVFPITPSFFENKVVLDAGCGMGRFSIVCSRFGAKEVFGLDASDSVEAAYDNAKKFPHVHILQGDIHRLPFRQGTDAEIDFAFSIGVLHHLDNPQKGFSAIVKHLKRDGTIFAWVYGRENNGWLVNFVNPVRTMLTSNLPRRVLYFISWLITLFLHPVAAWIYRPINRSKRVKWLSKYLFYNDYLVWLGQFSFLHNHHVVFDHLVAPVAFYLTKEEFEQWFFDEDMALVDLSWRNQNSWRGHGRFNST